MLSHFNYFIAKLTVSVRWSYWPILASILIIVTPIVLHILAIHFALHTSLSIINTGSNPIDPHPQG